MKKLMFILVAIVPLVFTSCNKDEFQIPVDEAALRAEVMAAAVPTTAEFVAFAEGVKTKAATLDEAPLPIAMVFPLDSRTISISGTKATKYFLIYEFQGNQRTKEITVSQVFTIKSDGKIDPLSGELQEAMPGCRFKEEFTIICDQYLQGVLLSCNFKDKRQVSFAGQINGNKIMLPPLEGGVWQAKVDFYDGDLFQEFKTQPINFYSETKDVKLKIEISKDNIKSYIEIPKEYLVGANYMQIFTENQTTGEITSYVEFTPVYDETLPFFVLFGVPFEDTNRVNIYGRFGRMSLQVSPSLTTPINGKQIFRATFDGVRG